MTDSKHLKIHSKCIYLCGKLYKRRDSGIEAEAKYCKLWKRIIKTNLLVICKMKLTFKIEWGREKAGEWMCVCVLFLLVSNVICFESQSSQNNGIELMMMRCEFCENNINRYLVECEAEMRIYSRSSKCARLPSQN